MYVTHETLRAHIENGKRQRIPAELSDEIFDDWDDDETRPDFDVDDFDDQVLEFCHQWLIGTGDADAWPYTAEDLAIDLIERI